MFKEITLAMILGGLLGIGLTGGFITLKNQNRLPQLGQVVANISPAPEPTQATTPAIKVVVNTPSPAPSIVETSLATPAIVVTNFKSGQITNTSKVTLKGTAPPDSQLVVVSPQASTFTTVTPEGLFEIDLQLETGFNQLEITSIESTDTVSQINFNLTYSTAQI